MRRCRVTINQEVIRTLEEIENFWNNDRDNNGTPFDPIKHRWFINRNRTYYEKRDVIGKFHQWGNNFEEFENGPGNYTVAIVELDDGRIVEVVPNKVVFINKED